jgi:hypothetical protein
MQARRRVRRPRGAYNRAMSTRPLRWPARVGAILGSLVGLLGAPVASAAPPARYLTEDRALVLHYGQLEEHLAGVTLPGGPLAYIDVKQAATSLVEGSGLAYTGCYVNPETDAYASCEIVFGLQAHAENLLPATAAHEVFHVLESQMTGSSAAASWLLHEGAWLVEGAAEWAAAEVAGADSHTEKWRREYFRHPGRRLFARTYDAIGFYDHMQQVGISPWSRFRAMFGAGSNQAAYQAAFPSAGDAELFRETEASVFLLDHGAGWPWVPRPSGAPPAGTSPPAPTVVVLKASAQPPVGTSAYTDALFHLSLLHVPSSTPLIELVVKKGTARLRSSSGSLDRVISGELTLCTPGARTCACPGEPQGEDPRFTEGTLALAGASTGAQVSFRPVHCEQALPVRTCVGLLPGYSTELAETVERLTEARGSHPEVLESGIGTPYASYSCLYLDSGEILPSLNGSEAFRGSTALVVSVHDYPSVRIAREALASAVPGAQPVSAGSEGELLSGEEPRPAGEETVYTSQAAVRVRNLIGEFSLVGDDRADRAHALELLQIVAAEL